MSTIWVAILRISPRTADKIEGKHHISVDEVVDAVHCVAGLTATWDDSPERGLRALIETEIRGKHALVVLYPTADEDAWNLGSVFFPEG